MATAQFDFHQVHDALVRSVADMHGVKIEEVRLELLSELKDLSDEELARLIKFGFVMHKLGKVAFEALFVMKKEQSLKDYFRAKMNGNEVAADDLTQGLLMKFWRGELEAYDPDQSFDAYLKIAAQNYFFDEIRTQKRGLAVPLDGVPEPAKPGSNPELEAAGEEMKREIDAAIERLPAIPRLVLRERMNGKAYAQIAEERELPIEKVYQAFYKARRLLKPMLKNYHKRENEGI